MVASSEAGGPNDPPRRLSSRLRLSAALVQEFPLSRNLNNEIHQRRSVMTLMGPPCSAIATIWRATVSMMVLFSSAYLCRS